MKRVLAVWLMACGVACGDLVNPPLDSGSSAVVSNALRVALTNEAALRAAGDTAGSNYAEQVGASITPASIGAVSNTAAGIAAAGGITTNGGTVVGALRTTVNHMTTAPASDEFGSAEWTRSLLSFGRATYMTTNMYPAAWMPTNTTGIGSYENPEAYTSAFPVGAVGTYIATMVDTNPVASGVGLQGPATVHIHLGISGGSPAANYSLSAKPEVYYTYDLGATNLTLGDFDCDAQTWTSGQTNGKTFIIAWPTVYPTSTYYRVYRLKVTAKGSAITNCMMGIGGTDSSFIGYQTSGEEASAVAANLTAHTNTTLAGGAHGGELDSVVGAIAGLVKADGGGNISAATPGAGNDYLTVETDSVAGAITGIVKADGGGNISAATPGTDFADPAVTGMTQEWQRVSEAFVVHTNVTESISFGLTSFGAPWDDLTNAIGMSPQFPIVVTGVTNVQSDGGTLTFDLYATGAVITVDCVIGASTPLLMVTTNDPGECEWVNGAILYRRE
jgi:hypothetical protein